MQLKYDVFDFIGFSDRKPTLMIIGGFGIQLPFIPCSELEQYKITHAEQLVS